MRKWGSDEELFKIMRSKLFTAVVGDVMDKVGLTHQFLPPSIKPLKENMVVVGRAMPVLEADYYVESGIKGSNFLTEKPFGLMMKALDSLQKDEVYVASGGRGNYAYWGEIMSTRAIKLKSSGAVLNGYSRDTKGILDLDFPTFSWGTYAQDQGVRGKVIDFRIPIEIEGIAIRPGDIIFGDRDGVLIIPRNAEEEVIQQAIIKAETENKVKTAINNGMSAEEAFETFGVL